MVSFTKPSPGPYLLGLVASHRLLSSAGFGDSQGAAPAHLLPCGPELEWEGGRVPLGSRSKNAGWDPWGPGK